jgi:L-asparaginase
MTLTTTKKILVIYTGGTFGMSENLEIPNLSGSQLKRRLEANVPEMKRIANCDVRILFNMDSCQMGLRHWLKMGRLIQDHAAHFDGAVILHGTDTLPYSAAALSLLLTPSPIPVVFTGAQKPLSALRNDARTNFITALEVAAGAPKNLQNRVMVAFHDEIFLGSRIRKLSALNFAAFDSPRFPALARVGSSIQYHSAPLPLPKQKKKPRPSIPEIRDSDLKSGASILKLEVTPEFSGDLFSDSFFEGLDGVLLTLFTSGTAPTENPSFIRFLERAQSTHTPIFAITEREDAPIQLSSYPAGKTMLSHGVLWCRDLTPEAAFVKAQLLHLKQRTLNQQSKSAYLKWLHQNWQRAMSDETG